MTLNATKIAPTVANPSTMGTCAGSANVGSGDGTNFDEVMLDQSAPDTGDNTEKQPHGSSLDDGTVISFALLTLFPQPEIGVTPAIPPSEGHDCSHGDQPAAISVPISDCLGQAQLTGEPSSDSFGVADCLPSFSSSVELCRAGIPAGPSTAGANFALTTCPEPLQSMSESGECQFGIGPEACASAVAPTPLSATPAAERLQSAAPFSETVVAVSAPSQDEGAVVVQNSITESQPLPNSVEKSANVAGLQLEAVGMRGAESARPTRKADKYSLGTAADSDGTAVAKAVRGMIETSNVTSIETQDTLVASPAAERVSRRAVIQSAGPQMPPTSEDESVSEYTLGDTEVQTTSAPTFTLDQRSLRAESSALTPAAVIHPAYRAITEVLQQVRPQGTEKMEIEVALADGEKLKVRLEFHNGEVRTAFQTNNLEIQQALQRGWSNFSHQAGERGFRVTEATFDHSGSHSQTPFQNQGEQDRRQESDPGSRWSFQVEQTATLGRGPRKASETASIASGQVSLWA